MIESFLHPHQRVIEIAIGVSDSAQIKAFRGYKSINQPRTMRSSIHTRQLARLEVRTDLTVGQVAGVQLVSVLQAHETDSRAYVLRG